MSKNIVRVGAFCIASLAACGGGDNNDGGSSTVERTGPLPSDGVKEAGVYALSVKGAEAPQFSVQAEFIQGRMSSHGEECTTETKGSCTIRFCKEGNLPPPEVPHALMGAGAIAITGARLPADHTYYAITQGSAHPGITHDAITVWDGGEEIHVTAAGEADGIPAFETTLNAPSFVTMTTPIFAQKDMALDTSKDFEATWTHEGAGSGNVILRFAQSATVALKEVGQAVECAYPASSDRGTIPASVLQRMKAYLTAAMDITTREKRIVNAGDWKVEVNLGSRTGAGKDPGQYSVNFN